MIVDEAHYYKNSRTEMWQGITKIDGDVKTTMVQFN